MWLIESNYDTRIWVIVVIMKGANEAITIEVSCYRVVANSATFVAIITVRFSNIASKQLDATTEPIHTLKGSRLS